MKIFHFIFLLLSGVAIISCNKTNDNKVMNPLLSEYNTPFDAPPFEKIKNEHYLPAFISGIKQQNASIADIVNNNAKPTFENTILKFENSNNLLSSVSSIFYNLSSAITNDTIQEISKKLAPLMANHKDDINLNSQLFEKISAVYNAKDSLNLSKEQLMLIEKQYSNFTRGGAQLNDKDKEVFRKINEDLSLLYEEFSQNLLSENNSFNLFIDNKEDLKGLSNSIIEKAAIAATEAKQPNKWLFTIHKSSMLPFLENAENRALREKLYTGYFKKGDNNNENDNKEIIKKIANLRLKRANLLGFDNHAQYILDQNMAKSPENVIDFLDKLMPKALRVANNEVEDMTKIAKEENKQFDKIKPWDYWFYSSKVKKMNFDLDENEVKPYLKLENARDGMFWVAEKLFGVTFSKLENVPVYHSDVEVFEAKEANGDHIGILYMDYFQRESKRSGAWCTSYRTEKYEDNERIAPIISIVCNFPGPTNNTPSLLSIDQTRTLFHEFGHALDGLFRNLHYKSLRVPRDFVELPSQIMENWAMDPLVLSHYAKHYKTGEIIPEYLVEKIANAGKFNQGFATTEYLAASYLDMKWHTITNEISGSVTDIENSWMESINLIDEIIPRYRSTYFQHIFSGTSYSSGYYSYIWAEVLDADAFEVFKENGIFDKTIAASFRSNILELGGSEDAMTLYRKFSGTDPNIDALLERRGLN